MKRVVIKTKQEEIDLAQCHSDGFYGIQARDSSKGFVLKVPGGFYVVFGDCMNDDDEFSLFDSIKAVFDNVEEYGQKLFAFDSSGELFKWLAE